MRFIILLFLNSLLFLACPQEDLAPVAQKSLMQTESKPSPVHHNPPLWEEIISDADLSKGDKNNLISAINQAVSEDNLFRRENAIDGAIKLVIKKASYGQALARAIKVSLTQDNLKYHDLVSLNEPLINLVSYIKAHENPSPSRRGLLDQIGDKTWTFSQDLFRFSDPSTTVLFGAKKFELPGTFNETEITASPLEKFRLLSTKLERYVAETKNPNMKDFFPVGKIGKFFTVEFLAPLAQGLIADTYRGLTDSLDQEIAYIKGYCPDKKFQINEELSFSTLADDKLSASFQTYQRWIPAPTHESNAAGREFGFGPPKYVSLKTEIIFSLNDGLIDAVNRSYEIFDEPSSKKDQLSRKYTWLDEKFLGLNNDAQGEQQK